MHHYLQVLEVREAEEAMEIREAVSSRRRRIADYLCLRSLCNMENEELLDFDISIVSTI
jgi:hypothetical protein